MASTVVKKMMPPGTTVWWVDRSHAASVADVLKVDLYKSGGQAIDISCAIVSGMTLNATDSETDSTTSICDSAASNTPVRDAYEANITFFREALDQETGKVGNPDSPAAKAFELFKHGGVTANKTGWLVKRVGLPNTKEAAEGHEVSAFLVMPDNPQDVIGEGTQPIQMTVPFMPQGTMVLNMPLTA